MSATYYHKITKLLAELKRDHPSLSLGKHLATSFDGLETKYLWGLTDKDFELLAKNFARIRNQLKITNDLLDKS